MKIDWLKPLLGQPGPFATVYLDATRDGDVGDREIENRWKAVRRLLERDGAGPDLLEMLAQDVLRPLRIAGPHGRVVVANDDGILVDRALREPPAVQRGVYGPVPELLQAARAGDEAVDYLLVVVDRNGADITWCPDGSRGPASEAVDGGHDAINKVGAGALSQRRVEARAEDSWERNAEAVAVDLERQVIERRPELVLLTGDVRAVALLRGELGKRTLDLAVEVHGGSRSAGAKETAFEVNVQRALDEFRARRTGAVLEDFRQAQGRSDGAVTELGDVVAVLARGQVREVLLADEYGEDELDDRHVWVGPEPLQVALTKEELFELGVTDGAHELPATVAIVRAALGQDAGLTFVAPEGLELVDGVGALLRWSDESTPSESAPSMSSDRKRLREIV